MDFYKAPANDNAQSYKTPDGSLVWPENDRLPEGAWDPYDPVAYDILRKRYPEIYGGRIDDADDLRLPSRRVA